ncbi:MAG: T9SS type A sorting domain-containing protein, partial [Bacteroidia bacterium]|nr:T9SS type A sorting domain-containing protein [Bacteroidia bacterium]
IYNMLGEQVYSHYQITTPSEYQIDLSSQPAGIYLYRVITETGYLIGEGKFEIIH